MKLNDSMQQNTQANISEYETQQEKSTFFGKIKLTKGISELNLYSFLLLNSIIFGSLIIVEITKVMLLQSKSHFGLSKTQAALVVGDILLIERVSALLITPSMGTLYDRWGRQQVLFIGVILAGASIFFMPFFHEVYPFFMLCRAVLLNCINLFSNAPIIGDYIRPQSKGGASGLFYIFTSTSTVVCSLSISIFLKNFKLKEILNGVGIAVWVIGFICVSLMKGGNYYLVAEKKGEKKEKLQVYIKRSLVEISQKKWLVIGLFNSLLTKVELFLVASYLILWTKSFYGESAEEEKLSNQKSSALQQQLYLPLSIFSGLFGFFFQKFKKELLTTFAYIFVFIGSTLFIIINDPKNNLMVIPLVCLGIGQAGLQVGPFFYQMRYCSNTNRGFIMGITSMISSLGGLLISYTGIKLYATVSHLMPMMIHLGLSAFSFIVCALVYIFMKEQTTDQQEQERQEFNEKLIDDETTR